MPAVLVGKVLQAGEGVVGWCLLASLLERTENKEVVLALHIFLKFKHLGGWHTGMKIV